MTEYGVLCRRNAEQRADGMQASAAESHDGIIMWSVMSEYCTVCMQNAAQPDDGILQVV
jgi:hypothetical protein